MSDNDGWIEWDGCSWEESFPSSDPLAHIDVRLRNGYTRTLVRVCDVGWWHWMKDTDIIAYKLREPVSENTLSKPSTAADPLKTQVGGSHYANKPIQPVQYAMANKLGPCEFSCLKYITRHKEKNGRQDIEKAIHFLQILLAAEYPEVNNG